jgi:predicted PurR-regulated permease PerM
VVRPGGTFTPAFDWVVHKYGFRSAVQLGSKKVIVPAGLAFNTFVIIAIVVATLYFAREILVPIALAVLLSFVLAPVVKVLQRWHLPRSLAVVLTVIIALGVVLCLATMVMVQVNQLARDLPRYQITLSEKVRNLRDALGTTGPLKNASDLLKDLTKELETSDPEKLPAPPPALTQPGTAVKPVPVEVHQPAPGASETVVAVLQPLVAPFTTIGIVMIFLIFFLFQREDLRNRFIRLVGSGDIERTTAALDDAGRRLGKLFATQLFLNAVFGLVIGSGLALIGLPSASLWGLLAMILRFVPYIGALMAAALPLALAAAVGGDWTMVIWTGALFAVVEPVMGQLIEPFIYGHSAGLSPVAIVLAAAFWTWLWGPLGLLLSTPLTLCLVVLARHADRLQFIDIMLGDQPALTPQQTAYQRMLTGDPIEAIEQARAFLKQGTVIAYFDEILIGALRLAQADAEQGRLDDARLENIFKTVSDLVEDLAEHDGGDTGPETTAKGVPADRKVIPLAGEDFGKPVFCVPGLGRLDDCAVLVVADALKREGIHAHVAGAQTAIAQDEAASICLCYLENVSEARIAYAVRRLSRMASGARIVVCLLGDAEASKTSSPSPQEPPRSLKATLAVLAKPTLALSASSGTKANTAGSGME